MKILVFRNSENESEEEEVEEEIEEKKDNTSEEEDKKVDKYLFLIYPMKYKYKYTRNAHLDVAKKHPKPSRPALTPPPHPLTGNVYLTRPHFKKGLPLEGGKSWQPFSGHKHFRQACIYYFRKKCVVQICNFNSA